MEVSSICVINRDAKPQGLDVCVGEGEGMGEGGEGAPVLGGTFRSH